MSTPTLSVRTEVVHLYQDDDLHRIQELGERLTSNVTRLTAAKARQERAVAAAESAPRTIADDIADEDPTADADTSVEAAERDLREAAEEHDQFVTEAAERAVKIRVQALTRKQWRSLVAAHPPRTVMKSETREDGEGNEVQVPVETIHEDDEDLGFNTESMPDALVPASIAPGQFDTPADRDAFIDALSDPDFSRIYSVAVALSTRGGRSPKAQASSLADRIIGEISSLPAPSA
ncbi:hypothetical protein [Nocardioides campestrisoli]|uniref:hypothetical protein n=1 Tax=Nocardioides campestrisoli TaxID=2736757 RepID=UPI0015E7BE48|nr:hypothetical protein [Nocardioides campestrisoli]